VDDDCVDEDGDWVVDALDFDGELGYAVWYDAKMVADYIPNRTVASAEHARAILIDHAWAMLHTFSMLGTSDPPSRKWLPREADPPS
jgi:hypothetical protein